ncbi:protein-L-histidine N-pros-methyltransferase isoform X3 [Tribolium castaneum]|uniref:protein-L-histidine N-pros-methyltransferase isoform X3 n=1 Tax=Tribolium castaneum TaxID=7070 RepID=UPI00046C09DE|nr:PREDICTED: methyltransferase-like protein 9 isoform X3 [Tribolium castaneum]|eukprot:XP_008191414.1 PREDICTED: methyltransferase-like protein 9 isoform X3 [Tribolium castaneum]
MLFEKSKVMLSVQWYHCDLSKIPLDLSSKFIELGPDDETIKFLQQSEEKSDWILTQIWHSVVKAFLGWFMTQTSINGWLQRGSMFVLSLQQFLKLLRVEDSWHKEALLDLGAGDGEVTAHLASLFDKTYVTEVSTTMRTLLQNRGYSLLDIDSWHQTRKFDLISCLNLLDRCDTPNQLLAQIKTSLKPDGLVLLAVVLPFSAYVEAGSRDHRPTELLPIVGSCFEEQVKSVVDDVLTPAGYEVVSWTRVPYLCEGDLQQSYYWLDDVVFVLKVAN